MNKFQWLLFTLLLSALQKRLSTGGITIIAIHHPCPRVDTRALPGDGWRGVTYVTSLHLLNTYVLCRVQYQSWQQYDIHVPSLVNIKSKRGSCVVSVKCFLHDITFGSTQYNQLNSSSIKQLMFTAISPRCDCLV